MPYQENDQGGESYRTAYHESVLSLIQTLRREADARRMQRFQSLGNDQAAYRREFRAMLGWPLTQRERQLPTARWETLREQEDLIIRRLQLRTAIGVRFYGLLFEHPDGLPRPLVIAQHGGGGTPELCSNLLEGGDANYHHMTMRLFRQGAQVYAPQLLLWNNERFQPPINRRELDAQLKQLGSSVAALEIHLIETALDYLSTLPCVDPRRLGMAGLSYGGFYTLFAAAADTRIKAALACGYYSSRYEYAWPDWTWFDAAHRYLDNEVISLIRPRRLILAVGTRDELFAFDACQREYRRLQDMLDPSPWLTFLPFDGAHEFVEDDHALHLFLEALTAP